MYIYYLLVESEAKQNTRLIVHTLPGHNRQPCGGDWSWCFHSCDSQRLQFAARPGGQGCSRHNRLTSPSLQLRERHLKRWEEKGQGAPSEQQLPGAWVENKCKKQTHT